VSFYLQHDRIEPRVPRRRESGRSYRASGSHSGNFVQPMAPVQHFSVALLYLTVTNWYSETDVLGGCWHHCGLRLKKHEPIIASSCHPTSTTPLYRPFFSFFYNLHSTTREPRIYMRLGSSTRCSNVYVSLMSDVFLAESQRASRLQRLTPLNLDTRHAILYTVVCI
jgi:hypothetical protein